MCVTPPASVDKYRDHGKLIRDVVAHCLKRVFTGPVAGRIPLLRTSGEEDREREYARRITGCNGCGLRGRDAR